MNKEIENHMLSEYTLSHYYGDAPATRSSQM